MIIIFIHVVIDLLGSYSMQRIYLNFFIDTEVIHDENKMQAIINITPSKSV